MKYFIRLTYLQKLRTTTKFLSTLGIYSPSNNNDQIELSPEDKYRFKSTNNHNGDRNFEQDNSSATEKSPS